MTLSPRAHRGPRGPAAAFAVLACAAGISGSVRVSEGAPVNAAAAPSAQPPSLQLSASQLDTLRVAPVGMYRFPIERTELGSVAFAEDPAMVQAESTLLGAAAALDLASKELRRARLLYGTQGISAREVEQAVSDQQSAAAALAAARVALRALGQSAEQIDRLIAAGRIAPPRTRRGVSWVEASVFESDVPLIRLRQQVGVAVAAYPGRLFTGSVYRIYTAVDPNLHRQTVRCEVADPESALSPGMMAWVTIALRPPLEAVAVPADAVVREGDGTLTAWVTTDRHRFTQRIIRTGLRENGEVQVLEGLRPGEFVVTEGAIYLDNMVNAVPTD